MRCNGCKEIRYCSKGCQKIDWYDHKLVCKTVEDFTADKRPSPSHTRAIIFAEKEETPRFVWLQRNEVETVTHDFSFALDFTPLLGDGATISTDSTIIRNGVTDRKLHTHVNISILRTPTSAETMSFGKVDPRISMASVGSIIFHGQTKNTQDFYTPSDLTASDFRHAVDEIAIRSDVQRRGPSGFVQLEGEKVTGVIVNCLGDQHIHRWPAYQPFEFHHTQWFSENHAAPTAIGLPVRIYRIEQSVCWNKRAISKLPQPSIRFPLLMLLSNKC